MKIELKDMTKDFLSNLFQAAELFNRKCTFKTSEFQLSICNVHEQFKCDELAEVLLRGGKVWYIDFCADGVDCGRSVSHYNNCTPHHADGCLKYGVTLNEFVDHLNDVIRGRFVGPYNEEDPHRVLTNFVKLITEDCEGDMFIAWSVAQAAFFGEIIY